MGTHRQKKIEVHDQRALHKTINKFNWKRKKPGGNEPTDRFIYGLNKRGSLTILVFTIGQRVPSSFAEMKRRKRMNSVVKSQILRRGGLLLFFFLECASMKALDSGIRSNSGVRDKIVQYFDPRVMMRKILVVLGSNRLHLREQ